jgi:hypothetical protein
MSVVTYDIAIPVIITRAANEGIPTAAIARIVQRDFDAVCETLTSALASGNIGSMPRADWPPAAKWSERLPTVPRSANSEDVEFQCRKAFKLTNLEAGFMMVLLRCECADKERLHNVIEQQRLSRANQPDKMELTDPKMVDVMICKLRKKLKMVDPSFLVSTSWGKGYYIEPAVKQKIFALIGGPYGTGDIGGANGAVSGHGPEAKRVDYPCDVEP